LIPFGGVEHDGSIAIVAANDVSFTIKSEPRRTRSTGK
jgi:hypothetical protein